jgi:N-acetylneuraminic acid mutarotase
MPTARHFLAAAAVDGIIYVVGGTGAGVPGASVLPVAAYDPKTDTWTNGANMLTGRATLAACAVNGIIYAIGGSASWPTRSSAAEAYDPKTNQWTTKSPMALLS